MAATYDASFEALELRGRHGAMRHGLAAGGMSTQTGIDLRSGRRSNARGVGSVLRIGVDGGLGLGEKAL